MSVGAPPKAKSTRHRVHEPGCCGYFDHGLQRGCNGWFTCVSCGRRTGWCRGDTEDKGRCPSCWYAASDDGETEPEARFPYVEAEAARINGKFQFTITRGHVR